MVQSSKKYIKAKCPLPPPPADGRRNGVRRAPSGQCVTPGRLPEDVPSRCQTSPLKAPRVLTAKQGVTLRGVGTRPAGVPALAHASGTPTTVSHTPRPPGVSVHKPRDTIFLSMQPSSLPIKNKEETKLSMLGGVQTLGPVRRNNALDAAIAKPSYIKIRRLVV